jgi:PPOX class probable F420-dependent enzyme
MDLAPALEFVRGSRQTVLTTLRENGLPQLSNVLYTVGDDDVIRISITNTRAKYRNLVRRPWAAVHVTRPDFFAYVVLECDVTLAPVAARPDDATVEELVDLYRALEGEHKNWDEYRSAMVADGRTVVRCTPTRAYGMLPRSGG